jgi:hypothetical protein
MRQASETMERSKPGPVKDRQTVTAEGVRTDPRIAPATARPRRARSTRSS